MQNMIKIPTTTLRVIRRLWGGWNQPVLSVPLRPRPQPPTRGMEKKLHHQVRRPTQFRIDNVKPGGARG